MAAATASIQSAHPGFRSSTLKRPMTLSFGDCRLSVDPDGSASSLDSLLEARALFGRSQLCFYKVQAGVVVPAPRVDWSVQLSPCFASLSGRIFDCDVVQSFEPPSAATSGYVRKVMIRNSGTSRISFRLVALSDPTAAHFGSRRYKWGSLGLEAFNRDRHVAMDEVSDSGRARVIGTFPPPERFYMTIDKSRAAELMQDGNLPEKTSGMSGHVLVLSIHEFDLAPSGSKELLFASVYNRNGVEEALSALERLGEEKRTPAAERPSLDCSSQRVSAAFDWAAASIRSARFEADILDRIEAIAGMEYIDSQAVGSMVEETGALVGRDGFLKHSQKWSKPGVLESSLFISAVCRHLTLVGDRKATRRYHTLLKRMAKALVAMSNDGVLRLDRELPQGWRRCVVTGYPAGEIPEVSLAAAGALRDVGAVSSLLGKSEGAAAYRERSELIAEGIIRRARGPSGFLRPEAEAGGNGRKGETIDMAIAAYRNPSLRSVASSAVHRLLEDDFGTPYGPRTVPTSDRTCFHSTYGQGQLGGYWTRAALAAACLAYASALPGVGSMMVEKVARLVLEDALKLGGVPGEFPYWVDVEGDEVGGDGSDPVAASRFIQAVVEGELGFELARGAPALDPPALSTIGWILARDIQVGERVSVFVGRGGGRASVFAACRRVELGGGRRFGSCEEARVSPDEAHGISFYGPGQVVCVGNSSLAPVKAHIAFAGRAPGLAKRLSTPLEELEPGTGTWNKIGSLRVSPQLAFDAPLGPGEWKAYRISND